MIKKLFCSLIIALGLLSLSGCIQMPSESAQAVDNRPTLMFKPNGRAANDYLILIDGLDVGTVGDYREGKNALRVLSGSHVITIKHEGKTILEQKVYLGDGTSKTIMVNL